MACLHFPQELLCIFLVMEIEFSRFLFRSCFVLCSHYTLAAIELSHSLLANESYEIIDLESQILIYYGKLHI